MKTFDWHAFLQEWSREWLQDPDIAEQLPEDVIASVWLGYPGATEAQIRSAEARVGTTLPPSYRAFLRVTNGWRQAGPFIDRLWSTEELDWYSVRHQDLIDGTAAVLAEWRLPHVPDEDYFRYGDDQVPEAYRPEYLQTALEISDWGDSAIYLLNPAVVTPAGEWEAWFYADWLPGANRYRSFQELMEAAHAEFVQQSAHYWSFGGEASTETR